MFLIKLNISMNSFRLLEKNAEFIAFDEDRGQHKLYYLLKKLVQTEKSQKVY